ncbi:hypothetical protein ABTM31_20235, partial [Acinetobacter baumannii]
MRYIDPAVVVLGDHLKYLSSLTYLDLSQSAIGGSNSTDDTVNGTMAIGNSLLELHSLTSLDLHLNYIGHYGHNEGILALADGFSGTPLLQNFDFFP